METVFALCTLAWFAVGFAVVAITDRKLTGMSWSDYAKEGSAKKSFLLRKTNMLVALAVVWPIVPFIFRRPATKIGQ